MTLVEHFKNLGDGVDGNYEMIKPLVIYLDNEDLFKANLTIPPPSNKVSIDVEELKIAIQ